MFIADRYKIDNEFRVHNLITSTHPEGDYIYDPFEKKEVLPFWGVMCTSFWGLDGANREYLLRHSKPEELENLQFQVFWVFWFSDNDLDDQKELFFYGSLAKEHAYSVQNIFNHLLEKQVKKVIEDAKALYRENNLAAINASSFKDLQEQIKKEN